jgi:hypothetical protein
MLAEMSHAIATAAGNRVVGLAKTTSLEVGRMKPATMYQVRSFELFYARIWDNQGRVRTFSLNHLQWKPALHTIETIEMEKIVRAARGNLLPLCPAPTAYLFLLPVRARLHRNLTRTL